MRTTTATRHATNGAHNRKHPPPSISVDWEWITPENAREYLDVNFERNRKLKRRMIEKLKAALEAGWFFPTHQGIAFDESGVLIDGQNRLAAIIESGVAAWLLVARGVNRDHIEAIDSGTTRSEADQFRISTDLMIGHMEVAVAKAMLSGLTQAAVWSASATGRPLRSFIERHQEAIAFACHGGAAKGITASIRGMIGKAYYHEDRAKLARFLAVMHSGIPETPGEAVAVRLRSLAGIKVAGGTTSGHAIELRCKAVSAIRAFLDGRPLKAIYASANDPWPLPE